MLLLLLLLLVSLSGESCCVVVIFSFLIKPSSATQNVNGMLTSGKRFFFPFFSSPSFSLSLLLLSSFFSPSLSLFTLGPYEDYQAELHKKSIPMVLQGPAEIFLRGNQADFTATRCFSRKQSQSY
uniref:Uncharacterized protein n=1 Tax=Paramoeba aestuarina TaxID=180227 RepID=A0A7S4NDU6_9EUKA